MTARRVIAEPHAARTATIATQQIRRDPRLVEKDVVRAHRAASARPASGAGPPRRQGAAVRRRVPFFLTVKPSRSSRHSVLSAAVVGNASRNSASVASGCAVISATNGPLPRRSTRRAKLGLLPRRRSRPSRDGAAPSDGPRRGSPRISPRRFRHHPASQSRNTRDRKIHRVRGHGTSRRENYHGRHNT